MITRENDPKNDARPEANRARRRYTAPTLVEYGNVREFTRGPKGSNTDATKGGFA